MLALLIAVAALDEREGVPVDVRFSSPVVPGVESMADEADEVNEVEKENARRYRGNISISSLFRCADAKARSEARSETERRFMVRRSGL
jgi:hypothetical protein